MFIQFLGTSAGSPTFNRNVTSIALILDIPSYEIWLFDCGEATQHQMLKTSLKLTKIKKIFITHLHGDHIFGLIGLLTSMSINLIKYSLEIYGVKGIKNYILNSLKITNSYISFPFNIYEIDDGEIFNNGIYKVNSFNLNHNIKCLGYYIKQCSKIGPLNTKKLIKDGIYPGPIYKKIKFNKSLLLNNNKIIDCKKYIGKKIKSKKIFILGDTAPLNFNLDFLLNADILIHEATLSDKLKDIANIRGHSTNIQAALLAKKYNVRNLIITHFSSRYKYKDLLKMLKESINIFKYTILAYDFFIYKI